MPRATRFVGATVVVAALAAAAPTWAQEIETRADALRQQREAKADSLAAPERSGLERGLIWLENDRLFERLLSPPRGFYPVLGSVTSGGGFAMGVGYREPGVIGESGNLQVTAAGTLRRYWMVDARLRFGDPDADPLTADVGVRQYDFPDEEFFGVGSTSNRADLVTYGEQNLVAGGGVSWWATDVVRAGARLEWMTPRISAGTEARSIETLFDDTTAPGLRDRADFVRTELSAELNTRAPRPNPRRGLRYAASWQHYADRRLGEYSFSRLDVDVQHYVPLLSDRRVLALHALTSISDTGPDQRIPFYLQRTLGGPDDLRGFRRFRFRGDHLLLVQAEYRWEIFSALDGALFYDAGKVTSRIEDLNFENLESNYGIGFRFGTVNGVFLRVEGAFGSRDGKHFILRYGHVY